MWPRWSNGCRPACCSAPPRSVTLTDAGELALRRCQQMLALTTDLEETATTAEGELRGQLRLTCSVVCHAQLGAAIADFFWPSTRSSRLTWTRARAR